VYTASPVPIAPASPASFQIPQTPLLLQINFFFCICYLLKQLRKRGILSCYGFFNINVGKTQLSLEESATLLLVFTSLHFLTFFTEQGRQPCVQTPPPHVESEVPPFMSSNDSVVQLYPLVPGSLMVASYDSQGYYGRGTVTRVHTRRNCCTQSV
jgi:hypothetical protein